MIDGALTLIRRGGKCVDWRDQGPRTRQA